MNIAVFLDEVTRGQRAAAVPPRQPPRRRVRGGPRPGHHVLSAVDAGPGHRHAHWPSGAASWPRSGRPARCCMFHGCLVHASPPNISPFGRVIVYLSLCRVDNHIRQFKRAEWIAHRDFTPIEALADDCLTELGGGRDEPASTGRRARVAAGRPVRVGLIGAGKFGSMFLAQAPHSPLLVTAIADLDVDRARRACSEVGLVRLAGRGHGVHRLGRRAAGPGGRRRGGGGDRQPGRSGWSTPWPASPPASTWWRSTSRPTRWSGR